MYAAIVSDTGSFKFSNTTPHTHHVAADLVDEINNADDGKGDTADVCRSLFGQRTLKELMAQMHAIKNLRFYGDGALGVVLFTRQMLEDAELTDDDIGNVVDTPRGVEGVLVGISLKQSPNDPRLFKVSSRANVECDVSAVCAEFGGGGHVRAAGCTIEADSPEEALELAVSEFLRAIETYKNNISE
jgi:phosphoesterase RecJ-like protein